MQARDQNIGYWYIEGGILTSLFAFPRSCITEDIVSACRISEGENIEMITKLEEKGFVKSTRVKKAMQNVDRGCFVDTNTYKICSVSTKSGAIILPPFVDATILEALHDHIKNGSHSLIMEPGSGYLSACITFMSGIGGRTESTLPDNKLMEAALGNFAKWLQYTKYAFTLGTQIIFRSVSDHKSWSSNAQYDAIYLHMLDESIMKELKEQLKVGGRLVYLEGSDDGRRRLNVMNRISEVTFLLKNLMSFQIVVPPSIQTTEESIVESGEASIISEPSDFYFEYMEYTSTEVKYVPNSKVLVSLCISIILFISLF
uniref:protein-L-isoaspartate(D-aspartate) O-methyltransferase n=1 Tax=Trichobilharzia regenti TaxID=157069 RepID=A0AA85IZ25_TRIRE|nr:unnamed protein product [Trichobilharzia regenti]